MRHQAWLGSSETLTAYAKLEEKFAGASAGDIKAFFEAPSSQSEEGPLGANLIDIQGTKAILNIQGSLVNADSWWHKYAPGEVTSYAAIKGAVSQLIQNTDIKDVVVNVSSGGGSFSGLSSAGKALKTLSKTKKVVGYTGDLAASAGMWLLSSAGKVYASETAELGSIGVIAMYQDMSKLLEEDGVRVHVVKAGEYKDYGSPFKEFSEEELGYLQSRVDQAYKFFVKHIASNRKLSMKDSSKWAEAQMFFASEAKAVGLVDEVADFEDIQTKSTSRTELSMTYEEKMALISAGTPAEEVLDQEELNAFYASTTEPEATEPELEAEVTPEPEVEQPNSGNYDLAVKLGRAEAKLEVAEGMLAVAQERSELLQAQTASLLKVAQAAVGNLQVALQKPKEVKTTADEVITQFDSLKAELSARFPSGRQSKVAENEEMDFSAQIPDPYQQY